MLFHSLVSLMAGKLYGNCEMKGPGQIKRARLNTAEGSSLESLSFRVIHNGRRCKNTYPSKLVDSVTKNWI